MEVDVDDLAWANHQGNRLFSVMRSVVVKDVGKILEKERGVLVVTGVLALEYELVPGSRTDHLLVGSSLERCQVFPYKLRVKLYPSDHMF